MRSSGLATWLVLAYFHEEKSIWPEFPAQLVTVELQFAPFVHSWISVHAKSEDLSLENELGHHCLRRAVSKLHTWHVSQGPLLSY